MTAISGDNTKIVAFIEYLHPHDGSKNNFVSFFSDGSAKFSNAILQQEFEEQGIYDPSLKDRNIQRVYPGSGCDGIRFREVFLEFEYATMNQNRYQLTLLEIKVDQELTDSTALEIQTQSDTSDEKTTES